MLSAQTDLCPAWTLHCKPYRERSAIVEYLVRDFGRVAMVVRDRRRGQSAGGVQPFTKALVSWSGRSELKSQKKRETVSIVPLRGRALYCGFYLNELLLRSVQPFQLLDGLYESYSETLEQLASQNVSETVLRRFEWRLLQMTGYAPSLTEESETGVPVCRGTLYCLQPGGGFVRSDPHSFAGGEAVVSQAFFSGELLLSLAGGCFDEPSQRCDLKRLFRLMLAPLVGQRPLTSRALFRNINGLSFQDARGQRG